MNCTIRCTGSKSLGRCYSASYHEITSSCRLDESKIAGLFKLGMLGIGQELFIRSPCDGTEEPTAKHDAWSRGWDEDDLVFVYETECRVDTSD